jgi:pilus assembly protein CpaB
MRMKSLILIFIALGCGLVASIGISQVMDRGGSGSSMEMEQILVALTDIDINTKLDDKNVKLEDWPKAKVPEGAIRRLEDIQEKFAYARFYKGEPLHASKITDSSSSTATKIPDGYRAMPVKVEEDTVMKAIAPGDKVDVMVFLKRDVNAGILETGAFTILKNVRVFAVNTNTERNTSDTSGKGESAMFRTISLLLKPDHTRELAVASRMGKILLTLRPPSEKDEPGEEVSTSIAEILKGSAENASEPVANNTPFSQGGQLNPNRGVLPLVSASSPAAAEVAWRLQVWGPNGTEEYQWADKTHLPVKTGEANLPPMVSDSAPPAQEDGPTAPSQPTGGSGDEGNPSSRYN